jgi:alanine racemase
MELIGPIFSKVRKTAECSDRLTSSWRYLRIRGRLSRMEIQERGGVQWIEVDAAALDHNLRLFRNILSPATEMLAVVKANAYGHGVAEIAPRAAGGADWLGVHSAEEARRLRRLGAGCPILVMGFVPPLELYDLDSAVHLLVSSSEALDWIHQYRQRTGNSLPIHIKVDIGTKRQGIAAEMLPALCKKAARSGIEIVGVASHFANIEDTIEHEFARLQLDRFRSVLEVSERELGGLPPYVHASCSAAALLFRETDFTLARVGISMYGHWPSRETRLSWILKHEKGGLQLRPVLTWKTIVGQLQEVERDASVGYGRTWTATRPSQLAVIPVGYADGYSRSLGNRSRVLIHGRSAPVVGRVCMNILMADVTDIPEVSIGDEVVLIGRQGEDEVTVEELASQSETINYEFLARISPSISRRVV